MMEKFKELSFEEMVEVEGGFMLWSPSTLILDVYSACVEFYEGLKEGFDDGKKLK